MFACIHAPGLPASRRAALLDCAAAFSPLIEETAPDTVVLAISGLERLFRSPAELAHALADRAAGMGLPARVAVAANPDAAVHAARGFDGVTIIPPGREAKVLGDLPVAVLAPPPEIAETLALWGIRTLAELAALPEDGLAERFGPEGVRLRKLALGAGARPLVPATPPVVLEESIELDCPVVLLEPLVFLLARLLHQLCARLAARGLAANELRLRLKLEDAGEHVRLHRLPFPMRDSRALLKLLQLDLESHPPGGPVTGVAVSAEPANPRVTQHGLFVPMAPEPERLELTLARILNIVGEGNAGAVELLDTHRPDAFRLKRFCATDSPVRTGRPGAAPRLALRRFRPPLHAKVHAPAGRPTQVLARGVRGKVVNLAGPWRSCGDWWRPDAWSRDEWDIALSDGGLYRIYFDRLSGAWFVEGTYD